MAQMINCYFQSDLHSPSPLKKSEKNEYIMCSRTYEKLRMDCNSELKQRVRAYRCCAPKYDRLKNFSFVCIEMKFISQKFVSKNENQKIENENHKIEKGQTER